MVKIPPLAPEPTHWPPGSEEKLEVMRLRVMAGYQPVHPCDAKQWNGVGGKLLSDVVREIRRRTRRWASA